MEGRDGQKSRIRSVDKLEDANEYREEEVKKCKNKIYIRLLRNKRRKGRNIKEETKKMM